MLVSIHTATTRVAVAKVSLALVIGISAFW